MFSRSRLARGALFALACLAACDSHERATERSWYFDAGSPDARMPVDDDEREDASEVAELDAAEPIDADTPAPDAAQVPDTGTQEDANTLPQRPEWSPATPDGPLPDCRTVAPVPARRDARWLVFRAAPRPGAPLEANFVLIGANGPGTLMSAGEVQADGSMGTWSSDGRHFLLSSAGELGAPRSVRVVSAQATEIARSEPIAGARMSGFAPARSTFVVAELSLLKLYAADHLELAPAKVPAPYGSIDQVFWSPDGRYYGFNAGDAPQPGLRLVDWDAQPAMLDAPFTPQGAQAKWSPDGRWLAFARYVNEVHELWLADWTTGRARTRKVAGPLSGASPGSHAWLDAQRLLWEDAGRAVHVLTLDGDGVSDAILFVRSEYAGYRVSPGGACVAYHGSCGGEAGVVCVRGTAAGSLPRLISHMQSPALLWSDDGGMLAAKIDYRVELLNLDGAPLSPRLAADGAELDSIGQIAWAPGARWLAFSALPPSGRRRYVLHLWNATTRQSFELDPPDLNMARFDWSPDGGELAIFVRAPGAPAERALLLVQRLGQQSLGALWTLEDLFVQSSDAFDSGMVFQP